MKRETRQEALALWKQAKEIVETGQVQKATSDNIPEGVSVKGYLVVLEQMKRLGLSGQPVIDCKTFKRWKDAGYKVKKGEKAKIVGISWKNFAKPNKKEQQEIEELKAQGYEVEEDIDYRPVIYYLFHRSQVEKLNKGGKDE
ncbi:MAG TPA: hypothetical protein DHM42_06130 [Clostridiales bacterium]|nr:hypothetical protein [Clostridiales bacterium]